MYRARLIPCLLLSERRMVKTRQFGQPRYLGDPLNIVRLFSEKEVDELVILDIVVGTKKRAPDFEYIQQLAEECFMPLCYGGGIQSEDHAARLIDMGVEKLAINASSLHDLDLIDAVAKRFGKQAVVAIMDVKQHASGEQQIWRFQEQKFSGQGAAAWAKDMEAAGCGEILLTCIDRDGMRSGYDHKLTKEVVQAVSIPVVAYGGASALQDCVQLVQQTGAAAAAASSIFVFKSKLDGVLISYPKAHELDALFA